MNDDVLSDAQVGGRVISGSALRVAGFIVANLLTTVAAIVLLRYLGVEDFGRYGIVLALIGLVQGISDAGLTATGSREIALGTNDDDRRDVLAHVIGLRIALTTAGVVAAIGFAALSYDSELVYGTALAGIGVILTSTQSAMLLPLSVELRNGTLALNEVLRQFVLAVCFIGLAIAGAGLIPFFGAQIVMGVVLLLVTPLMLARHHLVAPRWTPERIRALIVIALPVAIAAVLGIVYARIVVVLMSLLSSSDLELGYFVTSTRVFEIAGGIPFLVIAVMIPVMSVAARDDHQRLRYMSGRTVQVMTLAGVAVALVMWSAAEPVIVLLGGQEYEPAAPILQIQAIAAVTVFMAAGLQLPLFGMGLMRLTARALALGVTTVVVSGLVFIPLWDATGAAIAVVVGDVTLVLGLYVVLRRPMGPGWVPVGAMLRVLLAAALGVGAGLAPIDSDVARAALALVTFVVAALVLRTIPSEVFDAARTALARLRSR